MTNGGRCDILSTGGRRSGMVGEGVFDSGGGFGGRLL